MDRLPSRLWIDALVRRAQLSGASAFIATNTAAGMGVYIGSGAPTVAAAKGSIYLRSDGSSASTRLFVSDGGTTWIAVTTAS
jgi:hypothetical protein